MIVLHCVVYLQAYKVNSARQSLALTRHNHCRGLDQQHHHKLENMPCECILHLALVEDL